MKFPLHVKSQRKTYPQFPPLWFLFVPILRYLDAICFFCCHFSLYCLLLKWLNAGSASPKWNSPNFNLSHVPGFLSSPRGFQEGVTLKWGIESLTSSLRFCYLLPYILLISHQIHKDAQFSISCFSNIPENWPQMATYN